MKYNLTVNETQLNVMVAALEMYSRVGCGQLGPAVTSHPDVVKRSEDCNFSQTLDCLFRQNVYTDLLPYANRYYGIFAPSIDSSNRVAWDMMQVVRNRLAWDRLGNPPERDWDIMFGVEYDNVFVSSSEEVPVITKIED